MSALERFTSVTVIDAEETTRAGSAPREERAPGAISWDLVLQGLGVGAAVAGFVALVGGARVWARLDAAHLPTTQTLAGLPRDLYLVEGWQLLGVPLLLGADVAGVVHAALRRERRNAPDDVARVTRAKAAMRQARCEALRANLALGRLRADAAPEEKTRRAAGRDDANAGVAAAEQAVDEAMKRLDDGADRERDALIAALGGIFMVVVHELSSTPAPLDGTSRPLRAPDRMLRPQVRELHGTEHLLTVPFAFARAAIAPTTRTRLRQLARTLARHPRVGVTVDGHADAIGSDAVKRSAVGAARTVRLPRAAARRCAALRRARVRQARAGRPQLHTSRA